MSELISEKSLSKIPNGWTNAKMKDVAIYINGRAFRPSEWEEKGKPIIRIQNLTGSSKTINRYSGDVEKKYMIGEGDLLISWSATLGVFIYHGEDAVLNQHIFKVEPLIDKKFLYFLTLSTLDNLKQKVHGSGMQHITKDPFENHEISLPPLNEQKRIVAKIEELFSILDMNIHLFNEIFKNLNFYANSFLQDIFTGKLTASWRHSSTQFPIREVLENKKTENSKIKKRINAIDDKTLPSLPNTWAWTNFEEISSNDHHAIKAGPFGSKLKKEYYVSSGYKIYGQEQVIRNDSEYGDYYINKERFEQLRSCAVKPGDLLISLVGTIGKTLILPSKIKEGIINPRLIKITLDDNLANSKYIQIYFESQIAKNYFKLSSHGGTMDILNMGILKKLLIPLPPLMEQHEIIRRYELETSIIDNIKELVMRTMQISYVLRNSILKQAFEGKLVPQDPNDEPAEVLLQKIKQEKQKIINQDPRRQKHAS